MIPVGTSSQLQVEIRNSDQLLLLVAGLEEITTRVTVALVVLVVAVHFRMALQDQELSVKETRAVTPMVAEVVLLAVVAAVLVVWVLQGTLLRDKVDQVLQLLLLDPQLRMQAAAVVVVGR
jgi:type VI protein secretion system component VasF